MSASVGFFHRDGQPAQFHWLERMMTAVAHRGVDDSGTWCSGSVAFGHQMMWITPESQQEKLPLVNRRGDLVITADARIDNRQELCDRLNISPAEAKRLPDSALILEAYEKWGIDCPKFLLGDFAFALWDSRSQRLICVRDPMGVKALHYYQTPEIFAFSTEAKGILALPGVVKQLNEKKFAYWLSYNFENISPEETFFQNIYNVRPAHTLVIEADRIASYEYWQPDSWQSLPYKHDEEYLEAFRELFADAVKCRLRSVYPIGTFLSGGLDSSAIACVAARQLREEGRELTLAAGVLPENYQGMATDEREFVEAVCQQENLQPLYISAAEKSPYQDLERHFFCEEAPIVNFYYLHNALQAALAQQQVRTFFHGVGGELGPSSHGKGYLTDLFKGLHWLTLSQEIAAVAQVQNRKWWRVFGGEVVLPLFSIERKPYPLSQISPINLDFAREMGLENYLSHRTLNQRFGSVSMSDNEIYAIKAFQGSTTDAISAKHHLSPAVPYCDIRLLNFCLAVPAHLKFKNGWNRNLIRIGMEGILPRKVQWRPSKVAFSPDYVERLWKFGQEGILLLDEIPRDSLAYRYLDIPRIRQMLYEYTQSSNPTYQKPVFEPTVLRDFMHGGVMFSQFLTWFEQFTPSVGL